MSRRNSPMQHGGLNIPGILRFAPNILVTQTLFRRAAQDDKRGKTSPPITANVAMAKWFLTISATSPPVLRGAGLAPKRA